jgi:riboflavin-specific deaminase-like protein
MLDRERVFTDASDSYESSDVLVELSSRLTSAERNRADRERPLVTLSYAQSLDGTIAAADKRRLFLSCAQSMRLTHELRALHNAILVGIGTVLADDPQLNVRLVDGRNPQPVVVDSKLRLPLDANLLKSGRATWLAATEAAATEAEAAVAARGGEVLRMPQLTNGWVDIKALLAELTHRGIDHVLVEGGTRILTSFLQSRLVDYVVVTISPCFVGGTPALQPHQLSPPPRLSHWHSARFGEDLVVFGELDGSSG